MGIDANQMRFGANGDGMQNRMERELFIIYK